MFYWYFRNIPSPVLTGIRFTLENCDIFCNAFASSHLFLTFYYRLHGSDYRWCVKWRKPRLCCHAKLSNLESVTYILSSIKWGCIVNIKIYVDTNIDWRKLYVSGSGMRLLYNYQIKRRSLDLQTLNDEIQPFEIIFIIVVIAIVIVVFIAIVNIMIIIIIFIKKKN